MHDKHEQTVREAVREAYAKQTTYSGSCCSQTTSKKQALVQLGYAQDEVDGLPDSVAETAAGCGSPTGFAKLKEGEVVLDLGSGGGIDALLAAKKVGPSGRVIGLDMTPKMVKRAKTCAALAGFSNVVFKLGEIENIPLEFESVDIVISNCVINLTADKRRVFGEAFRVLKPSGRMVVSDIVTHGKLPDAASKDPKLWSSCLGGALEENVYLQQISRAGFSNIRVCSKFTFITSQMDPMLQTHIGNTVPSDFRFSSVVVLADKT